MALARIVIRNKPGVFDPEGKVVQGGLERLGHANIKSVRVGKVIDLDVDGNDRERIRAQIDEMCKAFLVNPVMENYSVEFIDE